MSKGVGSALESTQGSDLRSEWQSMALLRLRMVCLTMVVTLAFSAVVHAWFGLHQSAAAAALSMSSAGLCLWLLYQHRIPKRFASACIFGLWLGALAAVLASFVETRSATVGLWIALLIVGYGAVQLHMRWLTPALFIGGLSWLAVLTQLDRPESGIHLVGVVAALALSLMAFRSNRALASQNLRQRQLDVVRQQQLSEALASAQRELRDRQQAERDREQLREQFIAAQRLEAVGSLAGGVAHDMNNILASIATVAGLLEKTANGQQKVDLALITQACERGSTLTGSLLGFSRKARYQKVRLPIMTAVDDALSILARTLRKDIRLIRQEAESGLHVEVDRNQLTQALLNLCINAERAIAQSGVIVISVSRRRIDAQDARRLQLREGEFVALSVSDDGCGMDEETRKHAFEPFYTTRPIGEGSGLGLAMAYGTLRAHDGAITIESETGVGTVVECLLPLVAPGPTSPPTPLLNLQNLTKPRVVLLIDDERLVRYSITRLLNEDGCKVITADDGEQGLEQFLNHRREIDLVLLDMSMPRMNGAECFRWLREVDPDLPIICVSGYPLDPATRQLMGGVVDTLEKPFDSRDLFRIMSQALARRRPLDPSTIRSDSVPAD